MNKAQAKDLAILLATVALSHEEVEVKVEIEGKTYNIVGGTLVVEYAKADTLDSFLAQPQSTAYVLLQTDAP